MMFDPMYFVFLAPGAAAVAVGELPDPLGVQQVLQGARRHGPHRRPGGAAAARRAAASATSRSCRTTACSRTTTTRRPRRWRSPSRSTPRPRSRPSASPATRPATRIQHAAAVRAAVAALGAGADRQHRLDAGLHRDGRRPDDGRDEAVPGRRRAVLDGASCSRSSRCRSSSTPRRAPSAWRSTTASCCRRSARAWTEVLNAAALTYVAAAVSTLMTLLYFLMRAGLLGRRDD